MTPEKSCFFLQLETGCLLLGLVTFILSITKILIIAVFLKMELYPGQEPVVIEASSNLTKSGDIDTHHILGLHVSSSVIEIVLIFVIIIMSLWMMFSVLMVVGIRKKRVNFVMAYFLFGIAVSILYLLSGILAVIGGMWIYTLVTIVLTMIYMKCLTSVYDVYEKICQEKTLDDQEQLVIEDDPMIEY